LRNLGERTFIGDSTATFHDGGKGKDKSSMKPKGGQYRHTAIGCAKSFLTRRAQATERENLEEGKGRR